jgi:UDP-glucuronate decarboxylase
MQLATHVISLVGSRSRIVHRALLENDPKQRQPDISRAQEHLNWQHASRSGKA